MLERQLPGHRVDTIALLGAGLENVATSPAQPVARCRRAAGDRDARYGLERGPHLVTSLPSVSWLFPASSVG